MGLSYNHYMLNKQMYDSNFYYNRGTSNDTNCELKIVIQQVQRNIEWHHNDFKQITQSEAKGGPNKGHNSISNQREVSVKTVQMENA